VQTNEQQNTSLSKNIGHAYLYTYSPIGMNVFACININCLRVRLFSFFQLFLAQDMPQQQEAQSREEVAFLISSPTNILTVQDVILDSPVWRANVLHLEDQIDHFEKWIDGFIRALKNYIEATISKVHF
jgi:hypothetical protein